MAAPHSPAVAVLGYVAASLTTVSFIPQAIKTLRSGDTTAISLRMYLLFTSGIALWGIYGLLTGDGPLIVANASTARALRSRISPAVSRVMALATISGPSPVSRP